MPVVVAINRFYTDTEAEILLPHRFPDPERGPLLPANISPKGGEGAIDLANKVVAACEEESSFRFLYDEKLPIKEKMAIIARRSTAPTGSTTPRCGKAIKDITALGKRGSAHLRSQDPVLPVRRPSCWAGPPASPLRREGRPASLPGPGLWCCSPGDIMTMPGLPKQPAACKIDVDEQGSILGLF